MTKPVFRSGLAPYMDSLIRMKEMQGCRLERYFATLRAFDAYCCENEMHTIESLTQENINSWRQEMINNKANTVYSKYVVISQLIRHINDLGFNCREIRLPRCGTDSYVPYIFSKQQISDIFITADSLRLAVNDVNCAMYAIPSILRILYSTGIRTNEAIELRNGDVDYKNGTFTLRHTKNGQERLIPLSRSALAVMVQFRIERQRLGIDGTESPDAYFFVTAMGKKLNQKHGVYEWFRRILNKCGIPHMGRKYGPRVHDLRHTFAVHSLMQQSEKGVDLYSAMPWLSKYLGHKSPYATEHYVRLASDALESARAIQNDLANDIYPQQTQDDDEYTW